MINVLNLSNNNLAYTKDSGVTLKTSPLMFSYPVTLKVQFLASSVGFNGLYEKQTVKEGSNSGEPRNQIVLLLHKNNEKQELLIQQNAKRENLSEKAVKVTIPANTSFYFEFKEGVFDYWRESYKVLHGFSGYKTHYRLKDSYVYKDNIDENKIALFEVSYA